MWQEETVGSRVNEERARQARETGADVVAVGCPFCTVMLDSADEAAGGFLENKCALRKGENIFGFNIQNVSRKFLAMTPHYQSIRITRVLPDTVEVKLVPRQPVAVLGRRGGLAVDGAGRVFNQRNTPAAGLPLLIGYQGHFLKPGDQVQGLAADAAHLAQLWTGTDIERELPLRTVDVRGGFRGAKDALQVVLDGELTADVAWRRGRGGAEADQDLRERILFLRAMVQRAQREGRRLKEVDLTLDDYRQHNAVKYWN